MSTYYYMVCDDHKERTWAASRTAGGCCGLGDSDITLIPFIIAHSECNVRIVSESHDDSYDDTFRDWDAADIEGEIARAQEDGRWVRDAEISSGDCEERMR